MDLQMADRPRYDHLAPVYDRQKVAFYMINVTFQPINIMTFTYCSTYHSSLRLDVQGVIQVATVTDHVLAAATVNLEVHLAAGLKQAAHTLYRDLRTK